MGDTLGEQRLWFEADLGNQSRYIGTIRHHIVVQHGHNVPRMLFLWKSDIDDGGSEVR
jgi:hypothetical protein